MPADYGFDAGEYIAGGGAGGEYTPGALNNGRLGGGGENLFFKRTTENVNKPMATIFIEKKPKYSRIRNF